MVYFKFLINAKKKNIVSSIYFFFLINTTFAQKYKSIIIELDNKGNEDTLFINKRLGTIKLPFDTIILKNGKNYISKKYHFKETAFLNLNFNKKLGFLQIIFDNNLKLTGTVDSIWQSTVKGSILTNKWRNYNKNIVEKNKEKIIILHQEISKLDYLNDSNKIAELRGIQNNLVDSIYIQTKKYIQKNNSSFISLFLLESSYDKFGVTESVFLLNLLNKKLQNHSLGLYIKAKIDRDLKFNKGSSIPNFEIKDLLNKPLSSKQFFNQITLISFGGTWCAPCRQALPKLKTAYSKYNTKGVKFISISNEFNIDTDFFTPLIKNEKIEWENYVQDINDNTSNSLSSLFNINSYPTYILIGTNGIILERSFGIDGIDSINKALSTLYP